MRLLYLLLTLTLAYQNFASHLMGGNLNYTHISGNTYSFELILYRDCSGNIIENSYDINLRNTCGDNFDLTLFLKSTQEISPLCATDLSSSTCNGGAETGVEEYIFEGSVELPSRCDYWTFSFLNTLDRRNPAITNLTSPNTRTLYLESRLYNSIQDNNSARFTALGTPYVCENELYNYSQSAVDIDGDSLYFEMVQPRASSTGPIPYEPGHSITTPILPSVSFDNETGQLTFTPLPNQIAVVSVRVYEYRNGILIGEIIRDIQIIVESCSNENPVINSNIANISGGTQTGPSELRVCAGQELSFTVTAVDSDGNDILDFAPNNLGALSSASFSTTILNDSASIDVVWTPTENEVGNHLLTLSAEDDHCPLSGTSSFPVIIRVIASTFAGEDIGICPGGIAAVPLATGGTSFSWSTISGTPHTTAFSCTNCPNPEISPLVNSIYVLNSNNDPFCKVADTISVNFVSDISVGINDPGFCLGDTVNYSLNVDPTEGPHTVSWFTNGNEISNSANVSLRPNNGQYISAQVRGANGCTILDSIQLNSTGERVSLNLGDDENLCIGDTLFLDPEYSTPIGSCGVFSSGTCSGDFTGTFAYGAGPSSSGPNQGPFPGSETAKSQFLYSREDLAEMGMTPGYIQSISLFIAVKNSFLDFGDLTIKMTCTSDTSFDNLFFNNSTQTVYSPKDYSTVTGWNDFALDNEFAWDGTSSLIVEFCYTNGYTLPGDNTTYFQESALKTLVKIDDDASVCPDDIADFRSQSLPRMRFVTCSDRSPSENLTWSGDFSVSNPSSFNPYVIFNGDGQVNLSLNTGTPLCNASDTINISRDVSVVARIVGDTCLGPAQLEAVVTGTPKPIELTCGTGSIGCVSPSAVEVGTETYSGGFRSPVGRNWRAMRAQYLYTQAMLNSYGLNAPQVITGLYYNVTTKASSAPYQNYQISMTCTEDTVVDRSRGWYSTTNVRTSAPLNFSLGLNYIPFDNEYHWDGNSSLIIEISFANPSQLGMDLGSMDGSPSNNKTLASYTPGTGTTWATPSWQASVIPVFQFESCSPSGFRYEWTPALGLNDPNIPNPIANPSGPESYKVTVTGGGCPAEDSVFLPECPPLSMRFLRAEIKNINNTYKLEWEFQEENTNGYYEIQAAQNESAFVSIGKVNFYRQKYYSFNLNQNKEKFKFIKIKAFSEGNIYSSKLIPIKTDKQPVALFPNPSETGIFSLRSDFQGIMNYHVYSLQGNIVKEGFINTISNGPSKIDLSSLESGPYMIIINTAEENSQHKIIVRNN